jgi:hypothetical protein
MRISDFAVAAFAAVVIAAPTRLLRLPTVVDPLGLPVEPNLDVTVSKE